MTINNRSWLLRVLASMPDGTSCDVLASDLEAGNFEEAHFRFPLRNPYRPIGQIDTTVRYVHQMTIVYTGSVAEGYVSPFEMQQEVDL